MAYGVRLTALGAESMAGKDEGERLRRGEGEKERAEGVAQGIR
jgi:hypothetical protein